MTAEKPFKVSADPFFERTEIHESVRALATSKKVVIFAGAGVTIDQTGVGWAKLIRALLSDTDLVAADEMPPDLIDEALSTLRPIEAATILRAVHTEFLGRRTQDLIASAIGKKLYSNPSWLDGGLIKSLVELAVRLCAAGAEVTIATTNYETILEERLLEWRDIWKRCPAVEVRVQGEELLCHSGANVPGTLVLEYLHGRVTKDGRVDGQLAIDEPDYIGLQPLVSRILADSFSGSDLLIAGSSLTDPPLLAALSATEGDSAERHRAALMALPAFDLSSPTVGQVERVTQLMTTRMNAFGVKLLLPDFYSQVAQYAREVSCAVRAANRDGRFPSSYMERLTVWWAEWREREPLVSEAHAIIVGVLGNIRDELAASGYTGHTVPEALRLEVWVRMDPAGPSREMTLWGSSASLLTDRAVRRTAPLRIGSTIAAVQAFAGGKTYFNNPPADPDEMGDSGRWRTYLSCPISVEVEGGLVPVGAVTLMSQAEKGKSRINSSHADRISAVTTLMSTLGEQLLGMDPSWTIATT